MFTADGDVVGFGVITVLFNFFDMYFLSKTMEKYSKIGYNKGCVRIH